MPIYRVRAKAFDDYDDDHPLIPDLMVDGPREIDTGLVDIEGNPIARAPHPIGFTILSERD